MQKESVFKIAGVYYLRSVIIAIAVLALTACSQKLNVPSTILPSPTASARHLALAPPTSVESAGSLADTQLFPDSTPQLNLTSSQLAEFNRRHPRIAMLPANLRPGKDQAGIRPFVSADPCAYANGINFTEYQASGHVEGASALNTFYGGYSIPNATHCGGLENSIYAPTMKPPRSCLEISNQYYNGTQYFAVFDFCAGSGQYIIVKQYSPTFGQTYIRNGPGGLPYVNEYSKSFDPGVVTACGRPAQCDVAALWNYNIGHYEAVYARIEGDTQGYTYGWDQFEIHLALGPPTVLSSGARNTFK